MSGYHKVICGCECFIYEKGMYSYLLTWKYCYLEKLKYHNINSENRRYVEMTSIIIETFKNDLIPNVGHRQKNSNVHSYENMCPFLE